MDSPKLNIAVVGAGISGVTAAYYLQRGGHHVTLFEAADRLGGHTDTHEIEAAGNVYCIDSGFIVFNRLNYPGFSELLLQLDIDSQDSDMSFAVSDSTTGLEYNATSLNRLFCQRRNLVRPRFHRMLRDLLRFYRQSPDLLMQTGDAGTLGDYLADNGYSKVFIEDHVLPMACALWSATADDILDFPARYFVAFMQNHKLLQVTGRPVWRTVRGGSHNYLRAFQRQFRGTVLLRHPVREVHRNARGVTVVTTQLGAQDYDKAFICCHSDQALSLMADADAAERQILGSIRYQRNRAVVHSDRSLMPRRQQAWASWNVLKRTGADRYAVTYHMNRLQNTDAPRDFFVTLNATDAIDPQSIWLERSYHHPVYDTAAVAAQRRRSEIVGRRHTYYCGAYWGWGFHEDGVQSALYAVESLRREGTGDAA